jgi:hypothetical protein
LTGTPTEYKPGHWFNSAKFLDIEYQTYGWVWAEAKETKSILLGTHFRKKSNPVHLTKERTFFRYKYIWNPHAPRIL